MSTLSIFFMEDAKMLTLTDCGCVRHHARQYALNGLTAALVVRLVCNLPFSGRTHTYICEHGHTHCLKILDDAEAMVADHVAGKKDGLPAAGPKPAVPLR
jgi:hypothetical protein